jgi:hypothetical protein
MQLLLPILLPWRAVNGQHHLLWGKTHCHHPQAKSTPTNQSPRAAGIVLPWRTILANGRLRQNVSLWHIVSKIWRKQQMQMPSSPIKSARLKNSRLGGKTLATWGRQPQWMRPRSCCWSSTKMLCLHLGGGNHSGCGQGAAAGHLQKCCVCI